jgi:hypothetical protein
VVIDTTLRGVVTLPQDVGGASLPGECGLVLFEELTGGSEHYCLCDSGLGSGEKRIVDLVAGTYRSAFKWTGRNWYGPSDTGVPMGAPFPVGSYTLRVSAVGSYLGADYTISATFPIWLTP